MKYDLLLKAQAGDIEARDLFFEQNMNLIWFVINRRYFKKHEREDLFQEGAFGLLRAMELFDPSRGHTFSTYAVPHIFSHIQRRLAVHGASLKSARDDKVLGMKIIKAADILFNRLGRNPTIQEIATHLGITEEKAKFGRGVFSVPVSLDIQVHSDGESILSLVDCLPDKSTLPLEDYVALKIELETLEAEERHVLEGYFFKGHKQQEIADQLGIAQSVVSRIRKKVLKKLRRRLESG